ncbi:MAG: glycosyltransferase family 2 protein, partial [Rhizomicrobium sp.]
MFARASVSVVIPAYNAEDTLTRALESVLVQTWPAREIIVVDDASADGTPKIAQSYENRGVTLLKCSKQRGAAGARNAGIASATCAWVAFLDADDEWLPSKLEEQVKTIEADPEIAFVFSASHEVCSDGHILGDTFHGAEPKCANAAWKALLARNFVATPTVVASRALLLQAGGFDETLKIGEDQDMWIKLALAGRVAYVPESLVRVHVRNDSLSAWSLADQRAHTLPMIERHLLRQGGRLGCAEKRRILGERVRNTGLSACMHGDMKNGLTLIAQSVGLGYRPLQG